MAEDNPKVTAEIMALAQVRLGGGHRRSAGRAHDGDRRGDYTEFNGDYPTRIDGKAMNVAMAQIVPSTKSVFGDMQNAKVQTYGDTAILTYNYAGITRGPDGKTEPSVAKSTRVYVKDGGQWKLVRQLRASSRRGKLIESVGSEMRSHSHSTFLWFRF